MNSYGLLALCIIVVLVALKLRPLIAGRARTGATISRLPEWTVNQWLSLLVIGIVLAVAVWGYITSPKMAGMGGVSWKYWLTVLAVLVGMYVLLELNADSIGSATKTLKNLVVAVGLTALVVLPLVWAFSGDGDGKSKVAAVARAPGDSMLAPIKVERGKWQHVMLLPKERKFLRIDLNTHVEIIGKGVRVLDICADNQARLPRQCPATSPPQQVSIENERDETNIILAQAFS